MKTEPNTNINKLRKIFKDNSRKIFLFDAIAGRSFNYGEIEEFSLKAVSVLRDLGFKKGDKLAILSSNCAEFIMIYFTCLHLGAIPVPLNVQLQPEEIQKMLLKCGAIGLFFNESLFSKLKSVIEAQPELKLLSFKPNNPDWFSKKESANGRTDFFALVSRARRSKEKFLGIINDLDTAIIIFTSGTTKAPKGVEITFGKIISNGLAFIEIIGLNSQLRFYGIMSLSYLGGFYNLMLIPMLMGGSLVLDYEFNINTAVRFWDKIRKYKINALWLVPSMVSVLLSMDRDKAGWEYGAKNIKIGLIGTAPLPLILKKRFEERYGFKLYENYGLSETFFVSTNSPKHSNNRGVGKIMPGCKVEIRDEQGRNCQAGQLGEIVIDSSYLMKGYFQGSPEDCENLKDGEFYSGDMGYIDVDGYLFVNDRKKDLIIRGGVNISPKEIEEIILLNPKVKEAAVVGVPNELYGEKIVAFLTVNHGLQKKAIMELCQKHLAPFKVPQEIIFIKELFKSSSGKIQKNKLREKLVNSLKKKIYPKKNLSEVIQNISPAMSVKYNMMVYELKQKGKDIITLSLGEAFFKLPAISFDKLSFDRGCHYSSSWGLLKLREKVSQYYEQFGVKSYPSKEILISAGSKIVIYQILISLVNPGDEIIVLEPAWVSYEEQIKLCYGRPIMVPYYENVKNLKSFVSSKTKAIIINNPNNPSGKVFTRQELVSIYKLAKSYGIYIISDEAYSDFTREEPFVSFGTIDKEKKLTFLVNSFSKSLGVSGWRVGYVIARHDYLENVLKVNQHLITCPATFFEYLLINYFDKIIKKTKPQIQTMLKKRAEIASHMNKIGLRYLPGTGTFYFMVSIEDSILDSEEFGLRLLNEFRVAVVPGRGYGESVNKFLRVSIGTENIDRIKAGLGAMKRLIDLTSSSGLLRKN